MDETPGQYAANVTTDTAALLRDADAEVSALTGGAADQTVSARVAADAQRGAWWARWFCAALSLLVQPGHCQAMRAAAPVPWWAYPRAGLCFGALGVAMDPRWHIIAWWGAAMLLNAAIGVRMLIRRAP